MSRGKTPKLTTTINQIITKGNQSFDAHDDDAKQAAITYRRAPCTDTDTDTYSDREVYINNKIKCAQSLFLPCNCISVAFPVLIYFP